MASRTANLKALFVLLFALLATIANAASIGYREPDEPLPAPGPNIPCGPGVGGAGCTPPKSVNSMTIANTGTGSADVVVTYNRADGKTETAVATIAAGASQSFGLREYQGEGQSWTSVMEIVSVQVSSVGAGMSNFAAPFPGVNGVTVDYKLEIKGVSAPTPAPAPVPVPPVVIPCGDADAGCTPPKSVRSMTITNTGTGSADIVVTYKRADGQTEQATGTIAAGASQFFGRREYQGAGQTWTSVMEIASVQVSSVGAGNSIIAAPFSGVTGITENYKLDIKGVPSPTPAPAPTPIPVIPCVGTNGGCTPPARVNSMIIANTGTGPADVVVTYKRADGKTETAVATIAAGASQSFGLREYQGEGQSWTSVMEIVSVQVSSVGAGVSNLAAPFRGVNGVTVDYKLEIKGVPAPTPVPIPVPEPKPITPCVGTNGGCRPPTYVKGATIFNRSGRPLRIVAVYTSADGKKSERQVSVVRAGQSVVFAPRQWQENGASFTQVLPLAHITVSIDGQRTGRRFLAPFGTTGISNNVDLTAKMAGVRVSLARGRPAANIGY